MLKSFNLMYYVAGMNGDWVDELDHIEREHYYKLLRDRKEQEAKPPPKKE